MDKKGKISIAFEDAWERESVALFSDRGTDLVELAQTFQATFYNPPLVENALAGYIMIDFISWVSEHLYEGMYLGMDGTDGDNSDCGHYVISIISGQIIRHGEVC
jgi:hypothetical protein